MKNSQKWRIWCALPSILCLALISLVFQSHTVPVEPPATTCSCSSVYDMSLIGRTYTSASFDWDVAGSPDNFKVWYYRSEDNYTSAPVITSNPYYTFSSLTSGTYDFYVVAICGQEYSTATITIDLIM